jgi:hypothetical protein
MTDTIVDKTTIVKTAEPLHLKLERFAKTSKLSMTWNVDPNNPMTIDQALLDVADSNTKFMIEVFKTMCYEQTGAILSDDDGNPLKILTSKELVTIRQESA